MTDVSNELLLQILHKQDLILWALRYAGVSIQDLPSIDDCDPCPVCEQKIIYSQLNSGKAWRSCGCKLPVTELLRETKQIDTKQEK